ncbi:MAG: hypothetical protein OSB66_05095 [SAR202 cluster bacterium]|nr:hypothetical protein [SAR202 cluster bacterium]
MNWPTAIKGWLLFGLTGAVSTLAFKLTHDVFTSDSNFSLWEFGISLIVTGSVSLLISKLTRSKSVFLLIVTYLTLLIPVLGALFGSSGSEPLWQFGLLGLIGSLFWSVPFSIWTGWKYRKVK